MAEISADFPKTPAARSESPQTSRERRQLGRNFRRLPGHVGNSEEISADFPTLSAARKRSPPTSRRCRQLGRDLRRLPDAVGSSEEISADFSMSLGRMLNSRAKSFKSNGNNGLQKITFFYIIGIPYNQALYRSEIDAVAFCRIYYTILR